MKKTTFYLLFLIPLCIIFSRISAQVTDLQGSDLLISNDTIMGGQYVNVGTFTIAQGSVITVDSNIHFWEIEANNIYILGTIDGTAKGALGGIGGMGGIHADGSGNPGQGGIGGSTGGGIGGGSGGSSGGDGNAITQICGGVFCSGNRDGLNGGGGGAGGGSGGSYGGNGGNGGAGAYGTGFTGASGGVFGAGGSSAGAYGSATGYDISFGSGGGGAGGGGGGWSYGTAGGNGGHGGGMVSLVAKDTLIIYTGGKIFCNATGGQAGGTGAGESTNNSYTCSSSGYNSCSICPESVFDAAGGAGGGAGGGSGGGIRLHSDAFMDLQAGSLITANGGVGGVYGFPNSSIGSCFDNAARGGGGSGGRIKIFTHCLPDNSYEMTYQVNGGIGFQDGSDGTFEIIPVYPDSAGIITGDTVVCAGASMVYSIDSVPYAHSYSWNLPQGASIVAGYETNNVTVSFCSTATSGAISVTPVNYCGNGTPSSINVTVMPKPQFDLTPSGLLEICDGDSVLLGISTQEPNLSLQWQESTYCTSAWQDIPGANGHTYLTPHLSESTCFRLVVSADNCVFFSDTIHVFVNPIPPTPFIYYDNNTLFSNASYGNQWYDMQGLIHGATSQTFVNPPDNDYYVIVTDSMGCQSEPSNIVTVSSLTVPLKEDALDVRIFPNPANEFFFIEWVKKSYHLEVSDVFGRIVKEKDLMKNTSQTPMKIHTQGWASGMYFIRLSNEKNKYIFKVFVK